MANLWVGVRTAMCVRDPVGWIRLVFDNRELGDGWGHVKAFQDDPKELAASLESNGLPQPYSRGLEIWSAFILGTIGAARASGAHLDITGLYFITPDEAAAAAEMAEDNITLGLANYREVHSYRQWLRDELTRTQEQPLSHILELMKAKKHKEALSVIETLDIQWRTDPEVIYMQTYANAMEHY